jgi:soluble lytic murein transglycosylase
MKVKLFIPLITKKTAPYFAVAFLFPQLVNSDQKPQLQEINDKSRRGYAKRVLNKDEYKRWARSTKEWILLEKYIADKIASALPLHSRLQVYAIANAIIKESNRFGFDPLFILALIEQESRIQPNMRGSAGEIGLMQILPKTAFWIAKKHKIRMVTKKQLFDPVFNIKIGVRYLSYLHKKFPEQTRHSVAAYNMGPKNVRKILKKKKQPEVYYTHVLRRYKRLYAETEVYARNDRQAIVAMQE